MELVIKETGRVKEETRKQEPMFKIEDGILVDCNLKGSKTVTIPADVKIIDQMCFASTNVTEVILPEGIESIESRAFANCNKLKRINFPESLNAIKDRAFLNCHSLTEAILPETLAELGDYAFHDAGIKQLVLPKKTVSTGVSVFSGIKIKVIDIPEKFKLSKAMFSICQDLRTVSFETDGVTIPERCFYHCTDLTEIDINKTLLIEDSAFLKCHSLSVDTIPAHTYVGACAFSETGVTDVIIEDISKISERAFAECKPLKKLTINVPARWEDFAGLSVPKDLAYECKNLKTVTFTGHTENLSSIKEAAFKDTAALTEINLPNNIRLIEKYAFYDSGIKNICLPENLKQIGTGAFAMSELESITVPDKVAELSEGVFSNCYKLTEVVLPESITFIPAEAFLACHRLKTVHVSGIRAVGFNAFHHCKALKTFDFSQTKNLGNMSFAETGIREAVFSNKLTKLQPSSFCDCKDLQTVDLSTCNEIKTISTRCFEGCSKLTDVKLPPNVRKFGDDCFESVKFNTLVIKPGTRIDFHAFGEAVINELEFIGDADNPTKTIVDAFAFARASVGRLVIPDYMYNKFEKAISKMQ